MLWRRAHVVANTLLSETNENSFNSVFMEITLIRFYKFIFFNPRHVLSFVFLLDRTDTVSRLNVLDFISRGKRVSKQHFTLPRTGNRAYFLYLRVR